MSLKRRVLRLEQRLSLLPPTEEPLCQQQWDAVLRRWETLYEAAVPLLAADEHARVRQAVDELCNEDRGPYAAWLHHLEQGWSRLPEMPPTAMKSLLMAWLSPAADSGVVCNRCGLERPYAMGVPKPRPGATPGEEYFCWREFDVPCPGCGNADHDFDWAHLTDRRYHAWKELDGYLGAGCRS